MRGLFELGDPNKASETSAALYSGEQLSKPVGLKGKDPPADIHRALRCRLDCRASAWASILRIASQAALLQRMMGTLTGRKAIVSLSCLLLQGRTYLV